MTRRDDAAPARRRRRRPFVVGFVVGVALTIPALLLALMVPGGDLVAPFLLPGAALLRPLPLPTATWPGWLNLLLVAVVNGLVVGALAVALALVRGRARR